VVAVVDQEGVYYGQCTQICGDRHGYMPIEVHAVSKEKFAQWVDLVQHSTAKDKMRDANEKVLGLSYAWEDQPAKTARVEPASGANTPASDANIIVSR
jgi:cytochrome c oxidase subunit 2